MSGNKQMEQPKVISLKAAFETMGKVALGEQQAPAWAGKKVYVSEKAREEWETIETSSDKLTSLTKLYSDNAALIAAISAQAPESIAELARITHRAEPNVSRSIAKLSQFGIVSLIPTGVGKAKKPILARDKISLNLDLLTGRVEMSVRKA